MVWVSIPIISVLRTVWELQVSGHSWKWSREPLTFLGHDNPYLILKVDLEFPSTLDG